MRTLLYYPTIGLPPPTWVRRALLYWDRLAGIVPEGFKIELKGDFLTLIEEQVFERIHPSLLMSTGLVDEFRDEVCAVLPTVEPSSNLAAFEIHTNKLLHAIPDDLLNRVHRGQDGPWFKMERNAAFAYMGILARHLAAAWDEVAYTGTNFEKHIRPFIDPGASTEPGVALSLLLPAPAPSVPLHKVLKFRRDRRDELLRLRKLIDEFGDELADAAKEGTPHDLKHVSERFLEKVAVERHELKRLLGDSLITSLSSYLKEFVAFRDPPVLSSAGVGAVAGEIYGPSTGFLLGVGSITAVQLQKTHKSRKDIRAASPVTYLHAAARKGIVE